MEGPAPTMRGGRSRVMSMKGSATNAAVLPPRPGALSSGRAGRLAGRIPRLALLLAVVGIAGAVVAVTDRGAFFDEGIYLFAGRLLVVRGENSINTPFESWFMGSPFLYPVLAGVVQWLGGDLVAVRLVNVAFLLLAVWGVYHLTIILQLGTRAALFGAASFGLAGTVLFTGSFATYDISSL